MKIPQLFENTQAALDLIQKHPVVTIFGHGTAIITDLPKNLTTEQLQQLIDISFTEEQKDSMLQFCKEYVNNVIDIKDTRFSSVLDNENAKAFVKDCQQFSEHPIGQYILSWKQYVAYVSEQSGLGDFNP